MATINPNTYTIELTQEELDIVMSSLVHEFESFKDPNSPNAQKVMKLFHQLTPMKQKVI